MFHKVTRIDNSLTKILRNGENPDIVTVLTNPDLHQTVRNAVPEFLDYFATSEKDTSGHLPELLDWAFGNKYKDIKIEAAMFISRNAAKVLIEPAAMVQQRLTSHPLVLKRVDEMLQGNWSRNEDWILGNLAAIVERLLRNSRSFFKDREWVASCLISNIKCPAAVHILQCFFSSFTDEDNGKIRELLRKVDADNVVPVFEALEAVVDEPSVFKQIQTRPFIEDVVAKIATGSSLVIYRGIRLIEMILKRLTIDEIRDRLQSVRYPSSPGIEFRKMSASIFFNECFMDKILMDSFFGDEPGVLFRTSCLKAWERMTCEKRMEVLHETDLIERIMKSFGRGCRRNWHVVLLAEKIIRNPDGVHMCKEKKCPLNSLEWGKVAVQVLSLVDWSREERPEQDVKETSCVFE